MSLVTIILLLKRERELPPADPATPVWSSWQIPTLLFLKDGWLAQNHWHICKELPIHSDFSFDLLVVLKNCCSIMVTSTECCT